MNIEVYKGHRRFRQVWRWRVVAPNGRIVAVSGEAYTNRGDAVKMVKRLFGDSTAIQWNA